MIRLHERKNLESMNLLKNVTPSILLENGLQWLHPPADWKPISGDGISPGDGIRVRVPAQVDYFQDPAGNIQKDDAPYLYQDVSGDFRARVLVKPGFDNMYDAGALMVRHDSLHWAKLCYESTDFGTSAAISVVTNGTSDDANGVDLNIPALWLQVARQGDVFALHYSIDGTEWRMVRLFRMALPAMVKVGLVAQCPIGPGTQVDFHDFSISTVAVKDIRAGI